MLKITSPIKKYAERWTWTMAALSLVSATITNGVAAAGDPRIQKTGFNLLAALKGIGEMEYRIQWQERVRAYQAPNRAHNFRVTFYSNGFALEPRDPRRGPDKPLDNWKATFVLKSYGALNPVLPALNPRITLVENHVRITTDDILIDYINDTDGLHQTFLVNKRPTAGNLTLNLEVSLTELEMAPDPNGGFVSFSRGVTAEGVLHYAGLRVFDATGKELPSQMQVTTPGMISLVVDDTNARYPVLVDPWVRHDPLGDTDDPLFGDIPQSGANFGLSLAYYERWVEAENRAFGSVIVGAPYFDNGLLDQGAVFGYLSDNGGIPPDPNWRQFGESTGSTFGYSLAVAQQLDLPDDEVNLIRTFQDEPIPFSDLVVGAPGYNNRFGKVYVFYGNTNGINTAVDRYYTGTTGAGSDFGLSVAAGDVNRDDAQTSPSGFQDLLVGEPNSGNGKIFLWKGTSAGLPASDSPAEASVTGSSVGEQFGFSVAFAGNVNNNLDGDGFIRNDVLVGAPNFKNGTNIKCGKVYLINGTPSGIANTWYWTDTVTQAGARLGESVAGNAQVDDANQKDFVVGAPFWDFNANTLDSGRVHVYRANASGDPQAPVFLDGDNPQAGGRLGQALALGRLNGFGDQFVDIIAGALFYDLNPNDNKGYVFVFWGQSGAPNPTPSALNSGETGMTNERFGSSVLAIRKITSAFNNPCIAGGAPFANPGGVTGAGLVELYEAVPPLP